MSKRLLPVILLSLMCCTGLGPQQAGSSSETSTKGFVAGLIVDTSGAPVKQAHIALYSCTETPVISDSADYSGSSDENGTFSLANVDSGLYFIEITDADSATGYVNKIHVSAKDTVSIIEKMLSLATVRGELDRSILDKYPGVKVCLPEVRRSVDIDENGIYQFRKVVPYSYTMIVLDNGVSGPVSLYSKEINVHPGGLELLRTADSLEKYILRVYKLQEAESQEFNGNDYRVSKFWSNWAGRDSILLTPEKNAYLSSSFDGSRDAQMSIKAAGDRKGLYLLIEIYDDQFMPALTKDSVPVWLTDAVDISIDTLGSESVLAATESGYTGSNQVSALTKTSKQFQVWNGVLVSPSRFRYTAFFNYSGIVSSMIVDFEAISQNEGVLIEILWIDQMRKVQEWFIPWSALHLNGVPCAGKRLALASGYNDVDYDNTAAPDMLRWRTEGIFISAKNDSMPDPWGDLKIDLDFPY